MANQTKSPLIFKLVLTPLNSPITKIEQLTGFSQSEFWLKIAIAVYLKDGEFVKSYSWSVLTIKDCEIFQTNRIRNLSWKNDLFFEF